MSKSSVKKIIITLFLCILFLLSLTQYLDKSAKENHNKIFKQSLITFGLTKTLNGTISVIQGTELAITPWGLGTTLTLGEILDPVNDLVERFSWVMLVSSSSLAIQKIIMEIGGWWPIKLILGISILILLCQLWFFIFPEKQIITLTYKVLIVCLVIRFSIPCIIFVNQSIYNNFLRDTYIQATSALSEANNEAQKVSREISKNKDDSSLWKGVKDAYNNLKETLKIKERIEVLIDKLKHATEYIINLIVVFILQAIIIPIFVLWALLRFISYIIDHDISSSFEKMFSKRIIAPFAQKKNIN